MSNFLPRSVDEPAPTSSQNPPLYMVLVCGLVALTLIVATGAIVLAYADKAVPSEVIGLAGVAIGFLGGLLAPSPRA